MNAGGQCAIIRNGEALLQTLAIDPFRRDQSEREAAVALRNWQAVFPRDRLTVETITRGYDGRWEIVA